MCSFGTIETLRNQGSLTLLRSMDCDRMWHSMTRSVVDDDDFDYADDMKPRSRGVHSISFVTAFVFHRREGMNEGRKKPIKRRIVPLLLPIFFPIDTGFSIESVSSLLRSTIPIEKESRLCLLLHFVVFLSTLVFPRLLDWLIVE